MNDVKSPIGDLPKDATPPQILAKKLHKIRNPLHVVSGLSSILCKSKPLTVQQQEITTTLKENAEELIRLIDDLSAFLQSVIPPDKTAGVKIPIPAAPSPLDGKTKPARERSVLLVDDYAPNATVALSFLQELGYSADLAKNGPEAIDKFSRNHYDLVIMDIQMQDMDGLETAKRLRAIEMEKKQPPTMILAATGHATEDDRFFCMKAGMNDCLSKPFRIEELDTKIRNLMGS